MTWFSRIYEREQFAPGWLGLLLNPAYILRHGLYRAIADLSKQVSGRVLDFGCGTQPYRGAFSHTQAYLGIDVPVSGHDHHNSRIDCFYDGQRLPFADGQFDAVVSFQALEHVPDVHQMIHEIGRVTRPGGKLLLSAPFVWYEHETPFDFRRLTSFGLVQLLEKNGYELIELRKTSTYLLTLFQMTIVYIYFFLCPSIRPIRWLCHLFVVLPLNVLAVVLNALLPKRGELYIDLVVLARRR